MMLSLILVSVLIILLPTLSMIGLLIYGNGYSWLLNLNVTYETLWARTGSGLWISTLEKLSSTHLAIRITLLLLFRMWRGLPLMKNHFYDTWIAFLFSNGFGFLHWLLC